MGRNREFRPFHGLGLLPCSLASGSLAAAAIIIIEVILEVKYVFFPQGSKAQLEQVWEESDGLDKNDFDPKTFFKLHGKSSNKGDLVYIVIVGRTVLVQNIC